MMEAFGIAFLIIKVIIALMILGFCAAMALSLVAIVLVFFGVTGPMEMILERDR